MRFKDKRRKDKRLKLSVPERRLIKSLGIDEERLVNGEFEEFDMLIDYEISLENRNHPKINKVLKRLISKLAMI